jgi:hypothetical protein
MPPEYEHRAEKGIPGGTSSFRRWRAQRERGPGSARSRAQQLEAGPGGAVQPGPSDGLVRRSRGIDQVWGEQPAGRGQHCLAVGDAGLERVVPHPAPGPGLERAAAGVAEHLQQPRLRREHGRRQPGEQDRDDRCVIEEINPVDADNTAMAYYRPPAVDGSRPGAFCLLATEPGQRYRYEYEALAFHESVPGTTCSSRPRRRSASRATGATSTPSCVPSTRAKRRSAARTCPPSSATAPELACDLVISADGAPR